MRRLLIVFTTLVLLLAFSGCQMHNTDYKAEVLEYAMISEDGDLSKLDEFPNLEYVDLRGSTCYDEIIAYANAHPTVTVRYNVQLGEKRFNQDVTEIELNCYQIDYDLMLQNLKYLKDLKKLHINQFSFTMDQLSALKDAYPEIDFTYTVELCGRRYDHDVKEIDLAHMTPAEVQSAAEAISLLPQLEKVNLMDFLGQTYLGIADVKVLIDGCPNVLFNYEFNLFGQTVSTLAESIIFDEVPIGNDGIAEIREALGVLTHCKYLRLDSCDVDNEVMAQLRDDYPDKKIVWRVFTSRYSILTDEEMLRMAYNLTDAEAEVLKYCTEIKYMDVSSTKITNIDFISYMPNLECVLLTLTRISDLQPLTNCPNLTWLELCSCSAIDDLSCLSGLSNLKYLNIAATKVKDLSPLDSLALERMSCVKSTVKPAEVKDFISKHPDCLTVSEGSLLGYGWRYDDKKQSVPCEYYAMMKEVFRYDDKTFIGNRKEK